jgi:hypothetical protein
MLQELKSATQRKNNSSNNAGYIIIPPFLLIHQILKIMVLAISYSLQQLCLKKKNIWDASFS